MEVSTAVSRYKGLEKRPAERQERAERVHVCRLDFKQGQKPTSKLLTRGELRAEVSDQSSTADTFDARVYVVEDLSREVIELLGSAFNVDPHFFRSHINDYMWNTVTGDAVELRHLDMFARRRPYFTLKYLRPRYYRNTAAFEEAIQQAGRFNVLRQLDSDRSRAILKRDDGAVSTLMRAKASFWTRPNKPTDRGVLSTYMRLVWYVGAS